jgi:sirohydrochlorin cobaltochelatase
MLSSVARSRGILRRDLLFQPRSLLPNLWMYRHVSNQAILLMAHGSRDAEAREEYRRVHAALAARLAPVPVVFSILEFPGDDGLPSIADGWRLCLAAGARRIVALPFFLFPAGHVREDLPGELRDVLRTAGPVAIDYLPPLGPADEILETIDARAQEALATLSEHDASSTALIFVGAGTSDPDANGDLCKAARLFWERYNARYTLVETAWVSLTRPSVATAIDRCIRLGATRIALVPYFLNTGVLLKRIDDQLAEVLATDPGVAIARGNHFGLHPRLLDLLERRARDGLADQVASEGLLAVCGRSSCAAVAAVRSELMQAGAPVDRDLLSTPRSA